MERQLERVERVLRGGLAVCVDVLHGLEVELKVRHVDVGVGLDDLRVEEVGRDSEADVREGARE